jgi:hypothetical protein
MAQCLRDCWQHDHILNHDVWNHARLHGWSRESIHEYVWYMFAVENNTKKMLEDKFGDAEDAGRCKKNGVTSEWTAMFNSITGRSSDGPTCEVVKVNNGDAQRMDIQSRTLKIFNPHRPLQDRALEEASAAIKKGEPGSRWQAAGTFSNWKQVAATWALSCHDDTDFVNLPAAWVACLLQKGKIFRHKADETLWLSLGFRDWMCPGWKVYALEDGFYLVSIAASILSMEAIFQSHVKMMAPTELGTATDSVLEQYEGIPFEACPALSFCKRRRGFCEFCLCAET